ncbi:MAG: hypothetical protein OHK0011_00640 [Turneriella sp.]
MQKLTAILVCLVFSGVHTLAAQEEPATPAAAEKAHAAKTDKDDKKKGKKKAAIRLAEDREDGPPPEKDPATYELSNRRLVEDYTTLDTAPYDRGEHMFVSALFGGIGGAVVGGLVGFSQYDKNDTTASENALYLYAGAGAGAGAIIGITTTFFERGKIEQFAIGKFLMKYSWYGAVGGGLLGAGVGFIPYSSSNDYSDIFRYGGYGAGVGFVAGLVMFAFDLPEHLKLYTWRREDQNVIVMSLRF